MSKIITIPSSFEEIEKTKKIVDGYIIGIKDMSVNMNYCIDDLQVLDELKDKDVFISLNKNIEEKELDIVENLLLDLNNYNIKGVLFYDIGLLNIYNRLDLKYDLVWSQEHLTTNYNTINYWNLNGAKYAYVSSDITEEEIIEIRKNSKSKLLVNLFGYLPMFVSKRRIVKNYIDNFELQDDSKINYMEKEGKIYPIIDNKIGTQVYSNNILNGIKSYLKIESDYVVLNSFNIDSSKFIEVINLFKGVNSSNVEDYFNKINSMFENTSEVFLNTKTIYRVKNNEK